MGSLSVLSAAHEVKLSQPFLAENEWGGHHWRDAPASLLAAATRKHSDSFFGAENNSGGDTRVGSLQRVLSGFGKMFHSFFQLRTRVVVATDM